MSKYRVQYRYQSMNWSTQDGWKNISCFVTTNDLEQWWNEESDSSCPHELLQVVKL